MVKETLAQAVPSFSSDPQKLEEFDQQICREFAPSAQRKRMKQALQEIIGLKPGQWFQQPDQQQLENRQMVGGGKSMSMSVPAKRLLQKRSADVNGGWHDAIDAGVHPDLGLLELFHS